MLRIHCTERDLLRIRFARGPSPMTELVNALMMLQRRDNSLFDPWRTEVWSTFPSTAKPLLELVLPISAPDYLDSSSPDFEEGLHEVMSASHALQWSAVAGTSRLPALLARRLAEGDREARGVLEGAIKAAHQAIVEPMWSRIAAAHHDDLASRQAAVATEGISSVLADLFSGASWKGLMLEVARSTDRDVRLNGQGITLTPSPFWTGPPLVGRGVPDQPLLVVYQARAPLPLIDTTDAPRHHLGALLGQRRAAVLDAIVRHPAVTTSTLARRLGMSTGRAHEHVTVLREARLITSHRYRNIVMHMPTPLAIELNP